MVRSPNVVSRNEKLLCDFDNQRSKSTQHVQFSDQTKAEVPTGRFSSCPYKSVFCCELITNSYKCCTGMQTHLWRNLLFWNQNVSPVWFVQIRSEYVRGAYPSGGWPIEGTRVPPSLIVETFYIQSMGGKCLDFFF